MTSDQKSSIQEHKEALEEMATQDFTSDLVALLRSRAPLVYLTCNEEKRLKVYFKHLAAVRGYKIFIWDCYRGLLDLTTEKPAKGASDDMKQPSLILDKIIEQARSDETQAKAMKSSGVNGHIYLLMDFNRFLEDATPDLERRLKIFASIESMTHIVMIGHNYVMSPCLEDYVSLLDFPYPNPKEIGEALWSLVSAVQKQSKLPNLSKETKSREDEIIKAASGLTLNDAQMAFAKSVVIHKKLNIPTILREKQQIIRKRGILEYMEPKFKMEDVGGLHNMTRWLERRKLAFHSKARDYGLPSPKGVMCVGMPGCVLKNTKVKIKKISNKGKLKIHKK
ncbi:MAG: hypothetical protein ACOC56_00525 [Atribacterota bacterium]